MRFPYRKVNHRLGQLGSVAVLSVAMGVTGYRVRRLSSLCCLVFTTLPLARYDIIYLSPTQLADRSVISYSLLLII